MRVRVISNNLLLGTVLSLVITYLPVQFVTQCVFWCNYLSLINTKPLNKNETAIRNMCLFSNPLIVTYSLGFTYKSLNLT